MAESFAFSIADRVLGKLASTLLQQIGLSWGVKTELEELKDSLSTIQAVLLDGEEKQATNRQLSDWLGKLKGVFYDAEDAVDEFDYEALRQQVVATGTVKTKVRSFISSPKSLAFRHKMGRRVKEIKERLDKIAADRSKFNLTEGVAHTPRMQREREMTHSFVRASDVIGREDDKEKVVQLLMRSSDDQENVCVVPIVGIGGLGKTTLAKLVYNDERVMSHFSIKMWVCVTEDFNIEKLIKKILKEGKPYEDVSDLSMEQLQHGLRNLLEGEKFLLVLDDVWNTNREKWVKLNELLKGGANGSKILVTTRKASVASVMMGTFLMHELKGLSHEECLSLFVKCSFKDGEDKQYPNLLKIGEGIVEKCGGVPLAVRTLGSLLYSKREQHDWESIRDNEIWKAEKDEDGIMAALKLSYYELPYYLKHCFAFCSIFAKDCTIQNTDLISLWIAHGLIQSSEQNVKMEDVGNQYINELLSRSFFQDIEQFVHGVRYEFKMHDLVHDLAIFFAQPEYRTLDFQREDICENIQHVAFSDSTWPAEDSKALRFLENLRNVRTIYFQMEDVGPNNESFVNSCILRFKSIRFLDLSYSSFETLPNSIGSCRHLRYLNLQENNKIKRLPNSICKLYHLQTLLLNGCSELEELPRGIGSMISMRHLYITMKQRYLLPKEERLRCLNSLQTLALHACHNIEFLFEGMKNLIALRILVIESCPNLISLSRNTKNLMGLEVLLIVKCEKLNFMDGESERQEDLQSFGRLQVLGLGCLPELEALPRWLLHGPTSNTLRQLLIWSCPNFIALPQDGLQNLTSLQRLKIEDCPELIQRCKDGTGEDWQKIAHIPEIYIEGEKIASSTNNNKETES